MVVVRIGDGRGPMWVPRPDCLGPNVLEADWTLGRHNEFYPSHSNEKCLALGTDKKAWASQARKGLETVLDCDSCFHRTSLDEWIWIRLLW